MAAKVIRSQCYVVIPDPTYESGLVCWRRKPEWNGPVASLNVVSTRADFGPP